MSAEAPRGFRKRPEGSHKLPRTPRMPAAVAPEAPQRLPRRTPEAPRAAQRAPRGSQAFSRASQGAPRFPISYPGPSSAGPRTPGGSPDGPGKVPGYSQKPPDTFYSGTLISGKSGLAPGNRKNVLLSRNMSSMTRFYETLRLRGPTEADFSDLGVSFSTVYMVLHSTGGL